MANLSMSLGTAVCILIVYYFFKWSHQCRIANSLAHSNGCLPPKKFPHKDPFFGIDSLFETIKLLKENRMLPAWTQRFTDYGHTYQSKNWSSDQINSIHPANIHTVFSTRCEEWGIQDIRLVSQEPFCGRGLITTDGEEWAHARTLFTPGFNKARLSDLEPLEGLFRKMVAQIPRDGSTVDLYTPFSKLYLDMATLFVYGESIGAISGKMPPIAEGVLPAFEYAMRGSGIRIVLGPLKFLYQDPAWYEACRKIHRFVDHYIDKALEYRKEYLARDQADDENLVRTRTLLYSMAEQTGDRYELRSQIIQAHMTSQESTSNLLANVFFLLSRHPRVWEKLREEVNAIGDHELTWDYISSLKYVRMVLNETLRIYTILPQVSRTALRPTTLPTGGGPTGTSPIYVPVGTIFSTYSWVLHRDPAIWGLDAAEFKPERWDNDFKPAPGEFMPFGAGARICLGQQKAMVESAYVVVRMMQEFEGIESRDGREWTGQVTLTTRNVYGCLVSLKPRVDS